MKTRKYLCFLFCIGTMMLAGGCKDNETGGGREIKISIPVSEKNPLDIHIMEPKDTVIRINLAVDNGSPNNVMAGVKIDRSLVDAFNQANNTSYKLLSPDAYSLDKEEVILPRYNKTSSTINITLRTSGLEDKDKYLLPVTIGEVEGDENVIVADDGSEVAYVLFSKKVMPKPRIMAGPDNDTDPWEVVFASSERADGTSGWARYAIDDSNDTYWHHNYGQNPAHVAPFELIIDMKRTVQVYGVQFRARTHPVGSEELQGTGVVSWADVSVAEDITLPIGSIGDIVDSEYNGKTTFRSDVLLWQLENNPYLSDITEGRYLRITVWRSYNKGTADSYNGVALGEVRVWGRLPGDPEE